jgi:ATP-dependent Clp protease ATP-binding subunit ClpC
LVLAVSGFGAFSLLEPESGLHVLERPSERGRNFERNRVWVRVIPQVGGSGDVASMREEAARALRRGQPGEPKIVRHYRREPSPLVRDRVRGWRTGKLDQVLAGNFDLFEER